MKRLMKRKEIFYLGIFVILMIFFNIAHPLIIYDTDDWYNVGYMRRALPIWGYNNPIKVFPETVMSLVAYMGAYVIYPILGDYIGSLAISFGTALCIFILLYVIEFDKFIKERFQLSNYTSSFVTIIFVIFHFLFFKTNLYDNEYLFSALNVTCFFHYTIPALANGALVLYALRVNINEKMENDKNGFKFGVLILAFYLAICSNLYENAILAIFLGVNLVFSFIEVVLKRTKIKDWFIENRISIILLISWFMAVIIELSGERAISLQETTPMNLPGAISAFIGLVVQTNKLFVLICGLIVAVFGVLLIKNKDIECVKEWAKIILCCVLMCIYIVLLTAVATADSAGRSDVFLSIGFYILLCVCFALAYVMKRIPRANILIPVITFVLFVQVLNGSKSFKDVNTYQLSWEQCKAVGDSMLAEIIEADKNRKVSVRVHVPKGNEYEANWPHARYLGTLMSDTLHRHGIISGPMEIEIIPDETMNKKYNLNK